MFKTELSGKNQKFIKTLHNRVNTIAQNIRNTSTHYITRTLYMLQTLFVPRYFIYDYNYYVYQDIIDGYDNTSIIEDIIDNIGKTTNKDIIDIANEYLNNVYYSVDMRLKYVNEHDYKQKCFYNIQENEQNERKQYEEAFKSLYKTLNAIDMKIPNNKDYLSEIKELLKYIG